MSSFSNLNHSAHATEKVFGVRELLAGDATQKQRAVQKNRELRSMDSGGALRTRGHSSDLAATSEFRYWQNKENVLPILYLLVVDADSSVRGACAEIGRQMGFTVLQAHDVATAETILRAQKIDLVLSEGTESEYQSGCHNSGAETATGVLSLLAVAKEQNPEVTLIVMSATATVASAVETMRSGAVDILSKPFSLEELVCVLERAAMKTQVDVESRRTRERLKSQGGGGPLIGQSAEMEKLYRILSKVAHSTHPVLIVGESGTGKELVARSIHFNGPNAHKRFVPVDCGSLAPERIEAELFGHAGNGTVRGGVTSATGASDGLLVSTDGGTIFLDEVSELSLDVQAKLSRALQDRVVRPVGGNHSVPISARVLAASDRDLASLVEQGKFRKDLYFRLNVVTLRIPALRDRKEDIALLAHSFLSRIRREKGIAHTLSDDVLRVLDLYDWPGNVRELESVIERACVLSSGPVLHVSDLPSELHGLRAQTTSIPSAFDAGTVLPQGSIVSIAELEKHAIVGTIRQLNGDKLMAAKLLGIGKTTLYRKLKEYGLSDSL